ncbi:glycosyltransferase [Lithospermum erythrorhizon]|uniref:Glycosyltransferase n=1 Tax=Lithospermum erythrorhizon TaxID=34254 RepID=A0AAV3QRU9_LITER
MSSQSTNPSSFHIVMFPWFAMGHMTPFLHLSNELAKRGHQISFLLPKKAQSLPLGTETASEIPLSLNALLVTAMDLMQDQVKELLQELHPDIVFFDFSYCLWLCAAALAISLVPGLKKAPDTQEPPEGYPCTKVVLKKHEARNLPSLFNEFGEGITFYGR